MSGQPIQLLLVEDDAAETENFKRYLRTVGDVELLGCTDSSVEGLDLVEKLHPDGVVLDLELAEGDGLDFLRAVRENYLPEEYRPYVVVTTNTTSKVTLQTLRECGAGFILIKTIRGYSCKQVIDKFRIVQKYYRGRLSMEERATPEEFSTGPEFTLRRRLSGDLDRLGITPNLNGHNYILDAVSLLINDPTGNADISTRIYPQIAEKYHKQVANVERSIRSAIETAWVNTAPEELKKNYTAAIRPDKGKPMNKEFICYFASKYSGME